MVRRSNETAVTLQPTKDWRALEQIRWSKLERDNEMFKKIQKHRYMNIITSIQLEKSIKVKYYSRMEEKLNIRLDRLEGVKERYNIQPKEPQTQAKSCPIPEPLPPPPKSTNSSSSDLTISTMSEGSKSIHPGAHPGPVEEEGQEEKSPKHRIPNHEQLTLMVQNFLHPTTPLQDSLASAKGLISSRERKRVITKTIMSNQKAPNASMDNRSFYLTTS